MKLGWVAWAKVKAMGQRTAEGRKPSWTALCRRSDCRPILGSTTVDNIRGAGIDVIPDPTKKLPNHYRLIHRDGIAGFNDENLARLSAVFTETSGHTS